MTNSYSRKEYDNLHRLLIKEMESRNLDTSLKSESLEKPEADSEIDFIDEMSGAKLFDSYVMLVGSTAEDGEIGNDIDILIRDVERPQNDPFRRAVEQRILKSIPEELRDQVHFIYEPAGPHSTAYALYDLELKKKKPVKKQAMTYADIEWPYLPKKPSGEAAYDINKIIDQLDFEKHNYSVEKKAAGFHIIIKKEEDSIEVYTEEKNEMEGLDTFLDRVKKLSDKDFIIDGELIYYGDEISSRRELMKFIEKNAPDDAQVGAYFWDIISFDGKNLTTKSLKERIRYMDKLSFDEADKLKEIPRSTVDSKSEFKDAVEKYKNMEDSEGVVIKELNSEYKPNSKSDDWLKFRKTSTIKGRVIKRNKTKGGNYNYDYGIDITEEQQKMIPSDYKTEVNGKTVMTMGATFNTGEKAEKEDIIEIRVEEIWRHQKKDTNKIRYSAHKPTFSGVRKDIDSTSTLKELDNIVSNLGVAVKEEELAQDKPDEEGGTRSEAAAEFWRENWQNMIPVDKQGGRFCYQQHFRGLTEEESKMDFEELINKKDMSTHGDLRFESQKEDMLFGFTIFLGESEANADLPTDDKLLYMAKHPDEEKIEKLQGQFKLQQPAEWLDAGGLVTEPGGIGATSEAYAKFFELGSGTYKIGIAHKHLVEIKFEGDIIKGRALIMKAPIGGERKWLIDFYGEDSYIAQEKTLDEEVKELRESDTDHKYLIWNDPDSEKDPQKINIKDYKIEEESEERDSIWNYTTDSTDSKWKKSAQEWVIDQVSEAAIADPLWNKSAKLIDSVPTDFEGKFRDTLENNTSGKWTLQLHTIGDKIHTDFRATTSDELWGFTIMYPEQNGDKIEILPKENQPKGMFNLEGEPASMANGDDVLPGKFLPLAEGRYEISEVEDHKVQIEFDVEENRLQDKGRIVNATVDHKLSKFVNNFEGEKQLQVAHIEPDRYIWLMKNGDDDD